MNDKENAQSVYGKDWDGLLYETGNKEQIIIVFSGSDGGLSHAGKMARYFYDHDIPALALGYFKTKHTKKILDRISIELIEEAVQYLLGLGYQKIGIEGVSKGAELALAAAIHYPVFFTVIVKTPSWFYSEGLKRGQPTAHSCWTYQHQEISFTPYKIRHFNMPKMLWQAKEFNILPVNTGKKINPQSVIPVEKITAPILMFSTKADTIWPSYESCLKIIERLESRHFSYPYKHITYEHMSHMMLEYCNESVKYFFKSEKENPEACFKEREDMGKEEIEWIKSCKGR